MHSAKILFRIRCLLVFFMIVLALSGITAFPVYSELRTMIDSGYVPAHTPMGDWLHKVWYGVSDTQVHYPFIFYGVAVVRNTLRLLQDVAIPRKQHGRLMNACFDYIQSPETPIAVKAFSLTVLEHLAKDYPDILPELKLIIAEQWDQSTPAFRSRARKILNTITGS